MGVANGVFISQICNKFNYIAEKIRKIRCFRYVIMKPRHITHLIALVYSTDEDHCR